MSESKNLNHEVQQDLSNESSTKLKISTKQSKYWIDEMAAIYQLGSHGASKGNHNSRDVLSPPQSWFYADLLFRFVWFRLCLSDS